MVEKLKMGIDCTHHRTRDGYAIIYFSALLYKYYFTVLQLYTIISLFFIFFESIISLFIDMQCDVKFLMILIIIIYYGAVFQWCLRLYFFIIIIYFSVSIRSDFGLYSQTQTPSLNGRWFDSQKKKKKKKLEDDLGTHPYVACEHRALRECLY